MKCPNCKTKLELDKYVDVNIHSCPGCKGNLVRRAKMQSIQARRGKTKEELMDELIASDGTDDLNQLRCPRCLSNMQKQIKNMGSSEFCIDVCEKCELLWLDNGELAKLQVAHQYSAKGMEQQAFQERLKNMTPAEKKEYEDRIAKLPTEKLVTLEHLLKAYWFFGP